MYLNFYGLREEPFGVTPDPRFLYLSPSYREAQATLEYGIRSGRGFTALVANPGMGKTTLLFYLLQRYSGVARTAFIFLTQCDSREFLRYLMSELGADTRENDFVRLQEQFGELLEKEARAGKKVIAVVDEAQNLDVSVLETVRLLSDFETTRAKLLHIILTGQPELADKLASPALLQLRQRISHLVRVKPLNGAELRQYIEHRLRIAGYSGPSLFTREARSQILRYSRGIPRIVNNLCFNALSLGFALDKKVIDAEVMAEVSGDLDFEAVARTHKEEAAAEMRGVPPLSLEEEPEEEEPPASVESAPQSDHENGTAAAALPDLLGSSFAEPARGPMLVPPAQNMPISNGHASEAGTAEVGNLALHLAPVEDAAGAQSALAPADGRGQPHAGFARAPEQDSVPSNGAAGPHPAEKERSGIDVEAMASDCALFDLGAPKRWKRPPGTAVNASTASPSAATPFPVPPRGAVSSPGVTPQGPARPRATRAISLPAAGGGQPRGRIAPPNPAGRQAARLSAARMARKRRAQRNLYLAAGASLVLLLLLMWLLGSSGSSQPAQGTAGHGTPPAQNAAVQPVSISSDAGLGDAAGSTVLDVVDELPSLGSDVSRQGSRPAVVMRGTRQGEQLLHRVDPLYPPAAQANHIQGPVVLEATIGTHGFLRHLRVLKGNPLLANSVLDAVQEWRYQPRREHGRAVETPTRIVVNFQLVAAPNAPSQNR
jgi:TonB family protein